MYKNNDSLSELSYKIHNIRVEVRFTTHDCFYVKFTALPDVENRS